MKKLIITTGAVLLIGFSFHALAGDHESSMHGMMHQHGMSMMKDRPTAGDERISLNLSAKMKQHQLANMRSHLEAIQSIISLMSEGGYDKASDIAHNKLGLTPEMKKMCNMFANADFRTMGLAFHQSADELGDVLKTGNMKRSLNALHRTMTYCVSCHATFRQ
jgi:hypothetical protein